MEETRLLIRDFVKKKLCDLNDPKSPEVLREALVSLGSLLPQSCKGISSEVYASAFPADVDKKAVEELFFKHHYHQVLKSHIFALLS